jgi:hypothetical protein
LSHFISVVVRSDLGQQCISLIFTNNYFRYIDCKAYPDKKKETYQKELNNEWESIKLSSENIPLLIKLKAEEYLKKLNAIAAKKIGGLMQFFANSTHRHLI